MLCALRSALCTRRCDAGVALAATLTLKSTKRQFVCIRLLPQHTFVCIGLTYIYIYSHIYKHARWLFVNNTLDLNYSYLFWGETKTTAILFCSNAFEMHILWSRSYVSVRVCVYLCVYIFESTRIKKQRHLPDNYRTKCLLLCPLKGHQNVQLANHVNTIEIGRILNNFLDSQDIPIEHSD